jgi:RHS repeat-associated protein
VTAGSGPQPQFAFDKTNNRECDGCYDAAANEITDNEGHTYTYDAEGNVTAVDGGRTASYTYDALNRRVRVTNATNTVDYQFDAAGRRTVEWQESANFGIRGTVYWGNTPIAFHGTNGTEYFEQQDWLGTERVRTEYKGAVVSNYASLAFGDGFSASGTDEDPYHFAGTDRDSESATDHAQFRQYREATGRWMSPDPYDGSYDAFNPQSLNRYAYVLNDPLAALDPTGMDLVYDPGNDCYDDWDPDTNHLTGCLDPGGDGSSPPNTGRIGGGGGGAAAPSNFVRMPLPANHLNCTTSTGVSFPAPPGFSVSNIAANGATNGLSGAGAAVGQGGYYDFQRFQVGSTTQFFSGYTPVANVAVGAYVQGTGAPQWMASAISNTYAFFKSSNGATAQQAQFRNLGFSLAAGKASYSCQPSIP